MKISTYTILCCIIWTMLVCWSKSAASQKPEDHKFSITASFEPNMQVFNYDVTNYPLSVEFPYIFRSYLFYIPEALNYKYEKDLNHFTFQSGIRLQYNLSKTKALQTGLLYLREFYVVQYSNENPHGDFLFLYEYYQNLIRVPLLFEHKIRSDYKLQFAVSYGLNADMILSEINVYKNSDNPIRRHYYPLAFLRLVPEVNFGPQIKLSKKLKTDFRLGIVFPSIIQVNDDINDYINITTSWRFGLNYQL